MCESEVWECVEGAIQESERMLRELKERSENDEREMKESDREMLNSSDKSIWNKRKRSGKKKYKLRQNKSLETAKRVISRDDETINENGRRVTL